MAIIQFAPMSAQTCASPSNSATINLGAALAGRSTFRTWIANGATMGYEINDGTVWEEGYGILTHGTPDTLTRTVIRNSSGNTDRISFPGSATVISFPPSTKVPLLDTSDNLTIAAAATVTGALTASSTFAATGAATFSGAVSATDTLSVTKSSTFTGAATFNGSLTANAGLISNTLNVSNSVIMSGTVEMQSTVEIDGVTQMNNSCNIVVSKIATSFMGFFYNATPVGLITTDGSSCFFTSISDERFKIDDGQYDPEDTIDRISVRSFRWLDKPDDAPQPGLMAQRVSHYYPWAVVPGNDDKPWTMDMSKLVPLLIAEIQSLRRRVRALEAKAEGAA